MAKNEAIPLQATHAEISELRKRVFILSPMKSSNARLWYYRKAKIALASYFALSIVFSENVPNSLVNA
jgi:hypothetical protein